MLEHFDANDTDTQNLYDHLDEAEPLGSSLSRGEDMVSSRVRSSP